MPAENLINTLEERFRPLAQLILHGGELNRISSGNSFEIITSGLRKRELILEDLRQARHFIHIEYFRFGNDKAGREVREILLQKAAEGVEVRFLNNNMVGRNIPRSYFREMAQGGIEVIPFTHIRHGFRKWLMRINHQQHRKIVVIDGKVAYTGGMNLNDNYFYRWRDTHLRITGPAVACLHAAFADMWRASGGRFSRPLSEYEIPSAAQPAPLEGKTVQVVADAPENPFRSMQRAYEWILDNAHDYVYLQTPYFVPPASLLEAIKGAARRGVDVRLMLPKNVDTPLLGPANRAFYRECLEAGVCIWERDGVFVHCKTLVADDGVSVIGASNLDVRSFSINYEVNTVVYDRETALRCKDIFLSDRDNVQQLEAGTWSAGRKWYQTAFSRFLRFFSRML